MKLVIIFLITSLNMMKLKLKLEVTQEYLARLLVRMHRACIVMRHIAMRVITQDMGCDLAL